MGEVYQINIEPDQKCGECGRPKALPGGICMECAAEALKTMPPKTALKYFPEYWPCGDDVREMAARLIDEHHPEAATAKVLYAFRKIHGKSNGKPKGGTCSKQSSKIQSLFGYDYIIELAFDLWARIEPRQREALLLHELLHIFKDEDGEGNTVWKITPHNLEEFTKVVEVYGLWHADLEHMAGAMETAYGKQLTLKDTPEWQQRRAN